jgi:hypothetical protein
MSAAHVKSAVGVSASSAAPTLAFGSNVAAGNLICGFIQWDADTVTLNSVTDSLGNTYTLRNNPVTNAAKRSAMFYAPNILGGACTLTFTFSGATTSAQVIHEASGLDTSAPFDGSAMQSQDNVSGTDAATSTAVVTTASGDYIFGATSEWAIGGVVSEGTGFTVAGAGTNAPGGKIVGEYLIQGAAGSIAATFTIPGGGYTFTGVMAFKAAAGGGSDLSASIGEPLIGGSTF